MKLVEKHIHLSVECQHGAHAQCPYHGHRNDRSDGNPHGSLIERCFCECHGEPGLQLDLNLEERKVPHGSSRRAVRTTWGNE